MSDNKKKKYSKLKELRKPVILAKRETNVKSDKNVTKMVDDQVQPKILLKSKENEKTCEVSYAARESNTPSASQSPNNINIQLKDKDANNISQANELLIVPAPVMTRPIMLISSINYQINLSAIKMLQKLNYDFFVVGVVGMQSVGKSTIMNVLAADNFDSFQQKFIEKDGIFSTKFKTGKFSSLPRTDFVNMFVTKDRMILLDCPPVLCNSYKRDATTNELDDIKLLILLLTICHLVVVVQDDYFNLNLIRLIQFAELTKPNQDSKSFVSDYVPHILFVKNKGNHVDFLLHERIKMEKLLKHFFKDSHLLIFLEECDKSKRCKQLETNKRVNYFVFPEIKDCDVASCHPNLETLFVQIRKRVFMLPRNLMYNGSTELTEALWFDLVTTILNKSHFFLTLYEEIRRASKDSKSDTFEEV